MTGNSSVFLQLGPAEPPTRNEENQLHYWSHLTQERCQFGPPQIRDRFISPHLSPSGFVLQLHLSLHALEGGDLSLELVVELLQRLLFMNSVLTVESCLLPIAI